MHHTDVIGAALLTNCRQPNGLAYRQYGLAHSYIGILWCPSLSYTSHTNVTQTLYNWYRCCQHPCRRHSRHKHEFSIADTPLMHCQHNLKAENSLVETVVTRVVQQPKLRARCNNVSNSQLTEDARPIETRCAHWHKSPHYWVSNDKVRDDKVKINEAWEHLFFTLMSHLVPFFALTLLTNAKRTWLTNWHCILSFVEFMLPPNVVGNYFCMHLA